MGHRGLACAVVILTVATCLIFSTLNTDDSEASAAYDIRVFIENEDGSFTEVSSHGTTVKQVIENACGQIGRPVYYGEDERIESVGDLKALLPTYWNIHQWMPLGVADWDKAEYDELSNSRLISGTSYCLHRSERHLVNGAPLYDKPEFRPENDGYVFIRFDAEYDSSLGSVQEAFTTDDRISGFWIKGHGSNMGEVVVNAMESNEFIVKYYTGTDSLGNALSYWIDSFFGIDGNTSIGSNDGWAYWSQYMYLDDKWSYNQLTLGYYDPGVYRYAAVVYIISINYSDGAGEEQNVLLSLPPISTEEEIDSQVKYSMQDVFFYLDGELFGECRSRIGYSIPLNYFPEVPEVEGKTFAGWGYDGSSITGTTRLYGTYVDRYCNVEYRDRDDNVLSVDNVKYGDPSTSAVVPPTPDPGKYSYVFKGWTADNKTMADRSSIKEDLVLYPLYDVTLVTHKVIFLLGDEKIAEVTVDHGDALSPEDVPAVEVGAGQYFTGWGDIYSPIVGDRIFAGTLEELDGYIVTYLDAENNVFHTELVYHGQPAKYSEVPLKTSTISTTYSFREWTIDGETADLSSVTGDITLSPRYEESVRCYQVTFILDGRTVLSSQHEYGSFLEEDDIPVPDVPFGMKFTGWGDTKSKITQDITYRGSVFTPPPCTVTYLNNDGQQIRQDTVPYCGTITESPGAGKNFDEQYTYVFRCWSEDGANPADLSCITTDLVLVPLFDNILREYNVTFYGYDGKIVAVKSVKYGEALTDIPEGPEREATVDKVYTFGGWCVKLFAYNEVKDGLLVDFSCITAPKIAYAAYTWINHPYTLTIILDDGEILTKDIWYGGRLNESIMMESSEGNLLRFYRDETYSTSVDSSFAFTGDRTLYALRIPGTYAYTNESMKTVHIGLQTGDFDRLPTLGDSAIVGDISDFPPGKTVSLGISTIRMLNEYYGSTGIDHFRILFDRGYISVSLPDMAAYCEGLSDSNVEFSIGKGPTTAVKLNSSLKNVNWDEIHTVSLKVDGISLTDPASSGIHIQVGLRYTEDDQTEPRVWAADTNTGTLTPIPCTYSEGRLIFDADALAHFVTGTSSPRSGSEEDYEPCPYGTVEYLHEGEDTSNYQSTLIRMSIDNRGEILFVPSSFEGYPLWTIGADAFTGVSDAASLVIPDTVKSFDWTSLFGGCVSDVYFLGDMPEFIGDVPSSVTVHYSITGKGWEETEYESLPVEIYSRLDTRLQYCLIDGQVIILKCLQGREVDIPARINAGENGVDYAVTVIACGAFQDSDIVSVRIPSTIKAVQTRAFYKCSQLTDIIWAPNPSVTVLADECFRHCENLRSNSTLIPDTVRFIGFEAFRDDSMIRYLDVPDSVRDIRGGAFYNCILLSKLKLGSGITCIPERCFMYCNNLDGVLLPDSIKVLGPSAFYGSRMLTALDLNNVQTVGNFAFYGCSSLSIITLGDSLESVGTSCFSDCKLLKTVEAYCAQPRGFETCGLISDAEVVVDSDVSSGWSYEHTEIPKDEYYMDFETRTMSYVLAGLMVFFIIAACLSWRIKLRMY